MIKRKIAMVVVMVVVLLITSNHIKADEDDAGVVSLGKDLTEEQQNQILEIFGTKDDTKVIYVTNEEQIKDIVNLMKNISGLNLNLESIKRQLKGITDEIKEVTRNNEEVKSILQQILDFIKSIFESLFTLLGDIL